MCRRHRKHQTRCRLRRRRTPGLRREAADAGKLPTTRRTDRRTHNTAQNDQNVNTVPASPQVPLPAGHGGRKPAHSNFPEPSRSQASNPRAILKACDEISRDPLPRVWDVMLPLWSAPRATHRSRPFSHVVAVAAPLIMAVSQRLCSSDPPCYLIIYLKM